MQPDAQIEKCRRRPFLRLAKVIGGILLTFVIEKMAEITWNWLVAGGTEKPAATGEAQRTQVETRELEPDRRNFDRSVEPKKSLRSASTFPPRPQPPTESEADVRQALLERLKEVDRLQESNNCADP